MSVMTTSSNLVHPARKGPRPMTAQDLWAIPRVGAPVPAPDGLSCAVTVTTYELEKNEGRGRIWLVPLEGEPRALTSAEASSGSPAFSADGRRLAFTRKWDAGADAKPGSGSGRPQLYVMPLDGGEAVRQTALPLGVFDPRWLPDGSGIVFAAQLIKGHLTPEATAAELERRDKDPVKAHVTEDRLFRFWDTWLTTGEVVHLFVLDLKTGAVRDLTPDSTLWFDWMEPAGQYDIAPDGHEIALAGAAWEDRVGTVRSAIYTVPIAGGPLTCITPDHPAGDHEPRYSPDGKTIVYGMQHDPFFYADRVRIMAYDRAAKTHRSLFEDWALSPSRWTVGRDNTIYLEAEENARVPVFAWRGSGMPERIVEGGAASGVSVVDHRLFMNVQNLSSAPETHVCGTDGKGLTRITKFTEAAVGAFGTGEVREMTFDGAYGETVQMFVVLPPGFETGKKYPLVQVVHGGPHGTSGDMFHFRWNAHAFASAGYIAALVNFQGSTSWGQDFAQRIQGSWGDRPFTDVMKATDVMIATGMVDETRMAAAGGSYGGYMASWIAGHTDRFRCIINHAGVYDLMSQYASDWTMGREKSMGGEPWDGLEVIDKWNPARFAKGFVTPMLVIHGERDYRVPVTQGLECYGVLKAKGVPARLVYFPDENHWVLKPKNSIFWYAEVQGWLKRYLEA